MKNCTNCKHAQWNKTAAGRLHPSGDGRCGYQVQLPKLPASMWWTDVFGKKAKPFGGYINRRKDLPEHCAFFERESR